MALPRRQISLLHRTVQRSLDNEVTDLASLAWNLNAWLAICLPRSLKKEGGEILRMAFRRFLHSIVPLPCQVVKTARQTVVRLSTWTPWANVWINASEHFRQQRRLA